MNRVIYDFPQTSLYTAMVEFVEGCNKLIAKMTLQGRKIFGGRIRRDMAEITQLLFRAVATPRASQRRQLIDNAACYFHSLCLLLTFCRDLTFLRVQDYEKIIAQIIYIDQELSEI